MDSDSKGADTNFTNLREFKCAEGAAEISRGLVRWWPCASTTYAGKPSHKIILPLLAKRGAATAAMAGEEAKIFQPLILAD